MTTTNTMSFSVSSAGQICVPTPASQRISSTSTESQGNVRSTDISASDPRQVSRPRLSRGSCHTPDPCRASSSSNSSLSSTAVFADHDSGVVFSSLYTASGERITTHEFQSKSNRVLAPTLCLVIPSSNSNSSSNGLPSFALTLPSPASPTQNLVLPPLSPFTRASYRAAVARAPPSPRIPSLPPRRCPHTPCNLTSTPPPSNRCCELCALQQLACEVWWGSRGPMLCAPQLPGAASTPETRAVYYALGLPLGRLERACVDWDAVTAISFMRQAPRISSDRVGTKPTPVVVAAKRVPAPSRILRVFVRRARHVLRMPRMPMIPIPIIPRRRLVVRP